MKRFLSTLILIVSVIVSFAQNDTVVSLITAFPGRDIYELEGHSAIRINMGPGRDYAVSYGVFDFNAPHFVYRFVKGETDYMVGMVPFDYFLQGYASQGRRIEEVKLNLSWEEKERLIGLLTDNLKPENRVYRYNYVKDNCSTRPLEIIEKSLTDTLLLGPTSWDEKSSPSTFRDVMRSYHKNYPWYQFGIDLALGSGIDYPLSSRDYSFVPMLMAEKVYKGSIGGRAIAERPVALVDVAPDAAIDGSTPWFLTPLFVCWLVFALLVCVAVYDLKRKKITRWVHATYFGVLGLVGLLLTFLIFISVHEATSPNYLYFWLNPLCLIPTIFIWFKGCRKLVWWYDLLNFALLIVITCVWCFLPQSANAAFLPLVLGDIVLSGSYIAINARR